jgi:hypothetical protein
MSIRNLTADEIDVRVQSAALGGKDKKAFAILVLYKDARCDMAILDELYGITGWQRKHEVINGNLLCTVEIWDEINSRWVAKQDVGVESNTEKEKGQASDAFKRACVNIGIGRELYTAKDLFVWLKDGEFTTKEKDGKTYVNVNPGVKFHVGKITITNDKRISAIEICDKSGEIRVNKKP